MTRLKDRSLFGRVEIPGMEPVAVPKAIRAWRSASPATANGSRSSESLGGNRCEGNMICLDVPIRPLYYSNRGTRPAYSETIIAMTRNLTPFYATEADLRAVKPLRQAGWSKEVKFFPEEKAGFPPPFLPAAMFVHNGSCIEITYLSRHDSAFTKSVTCATRSARSTKKSRNLSMLLLSLTVSSVPFRD